MSAAATRQVASAICFVVLVVASCTWSSAEPPAPEDGAAASPPTPSPDERPRPSFAPVPDVTSTADLDVGESLEAWEAAVERIEELRITSSWDGHEQPALWLPPSSDEPAPLLVVLHSWSHDYLQHWGIPFARWADRQGWAVIHPDFRGPFRTPTATGSDVAVSDVVDAIEFGVDHAGVDDEQVYVIGFSGGGMMSLLLAGRHPDLLAGAVSWVPVHDLAAWYDYNQSQGTLYTHQIAASCGGSPLDDAGAAIECLHRSPLWHLDAARRAELPVYIAHGVHDDLVPAHHAVGAFNQLAGPDDHLPGDVVDAARDGSEGGLRDHAEASATFFTSGDPPVVADRRAGPTTLVLFDGDHEMLYNPGLAWIADQVDQREVVNRR